MGQFGTRSREEPPADTRLGARRTGQVRPEAPQGPLPLLQGRILDLQRFAGNAAVASLLAPKRSQSPLPAHKNVDGGDTEEEADGGLVEALKDGDAGTPGGDAGTPGGDAGT